MCARLNGLPGHTHARSYERCGGMPSNEQEDNGHIVPLTHSLWSLINHQGKTAGQSYAYMLETRERDVKKGKVSTRGIRGDFSLHPDATCPYPFSFQPHTCAAFSPNPSRKQIPIFLIKAAVSGNIADEDRVRSHTRKFKHVKEKTA